MLNMLNKLTQNNILKMVLACVLTVSVSLLVVFLARLYLDYITPSKMITKYQVVCVILSGTVFSGQSPDIVHVERIRDGILIITSNGSELEVINTPCTIARTEELLIKPVP